ncbi:hypothetical protein CXB51_028512 [Gossypium anomalum]|uniref:HTH OST-type domain-containing protein n=1 Tax=Gossypium anomalum TaxID=47600 RepID=A0A8J5Y6F9_9ROSI|nr:hypothetical protein CXB51_028512 [Gossypium anomalum]
MKLKHVHLRTLLSFSSSPSSPSLYSFSIFISHFSTSHNPPLLSYSSSWRHEEVSRHVKVSVWWDFENCNPPVGFNVYKIAHMITSAVRANGIKGPVQITAFGDILQLSRANQEALSSTGVNLAHVPQGGKNSADRSLLVDLLYWVSQNPPPAHIFLISGDRDFASVLHRLRMNNYNILLATSDSAPSVLCSAASIMWNWNALLKAENLTGKHYNHPPDGPYGSWYGHCKGPLDDPFLVEQPACTQTEEFSESCSDSVPRTVPKAVIKHIRQILNSYPNGISIIDLRSELKKSNVSLDKNFYGYKKFSCFLSSMPHILRLQSERDGNYLIHGIFPKAGEPSKTSPCLSARPVCRTGDEHSVSSRSSGDGRRVDSGLNEKSRLHHSPEVNSGAAPGKIQQTPSANGNLVKVNAEKPQEEVQEPLPVDQKTTEASNDQVPESVHNHVLEQDSASKVSFIRKVWQRWFAGSDYTRAGKDHDKLAGKDYDLPGKPGDSADITEKRNKNTLKKCIEVSSDREGMKVECEEKSHVVPYSLTISSSSNDSTFDTKATDEASENPSGKGAGLFNWIASRCKFWRSSKDSEVSSDQSYEKLNQTNTNTLKHEVFKQGSFWEDMEILIDSLRGSLFVTQSRTREEMAENLLKEGPFVLRSLSNTDLLHLVDLLISDKKWIEECPSQASPFKITKAAGKSPSLGHSHASNGLRSIFMRTPSQANLQTEHEGEKKLQNIPHSGVSSIIPDENSSDRSRFQVLSDCQNLVKDILKEHPEGHNVANFRKLFLERYGYPLDIQRLGYKKLVSVLKNVPGIKIESTYILPASMVPDDFGPETAAGNIRENASRALGELPDDATTKGDALDTTWDELGPKRIAIRIREQRMGTKATYPDYPSLSDDEFSDSEREISSAERSGLQQKPGVDEEDSSLLQILDSWYSSKEGKDKTDNSANSEGLVDCSEYDVKPSGAAGESMKTENCLEDYGKKQRMQKKYSFVADPVGNDRDKLINVILGSLRNQVSRE